MSGLFGDLFDFNHDGVLDGFEQAAEFATFMSMMDDEEEQRRDEDLFEDGDADYVEDYEEETDLF